MSTIKVDTYLTRGGASEIAIDKLKGASSAGSMTVVGEGGSTTTNLQQGLAKAWVFGGTDATVFDSLNVGSSTDHGTGDYSYTLSNAFSNAVFSQTASASSTDQHRTCTQNPGRHTASIMACETSDDAGDAVSLDNTNHCLTAHGDLA